MSMRTSIIQVGNSRGIRIPKPFLEQCQLEGEVELEISEKGLLIAPVREVRAGWEDQFTQMAAAGDDQMEDMPGLSTWDEAEWEWA